MDSGFVDIEILLTRIRNPQSKIYFLDAVKGYKSGALRGSMTSAWVALVYDLITKYRELSAMGDGAATAFLTSWDNATASNDVKKLLQLEGSILADAAVNTQVINNIARTHLERLREDRHLCAHPAFSAEAELFEPTHELVRLHLVNAVDLVLSQEPLQGRAIFDLFDVDVQSPGFPTTHARILDYVEQRYLERVRTQNIRNFGLVLAKSLLKGVPPQWDSQSAKIVSSLVAVRERATQAWPEVSSTVIRLIDGLEPEHRPRAIAYIAAFPNLWSLLMEPTRTALQETVENADATALADFRILAGVTLPQFRDSLLAVIARLDEANLSAAIAVQPLPDLWPRAIDLYRDSGSFRGSEERFRNLISPFTDQFESQNIEQLLDAIIYNGQNWDAAETNTLLLGVLHNTAGGDLPSTDMRNRFYTEIRRVGRERKYGEALTFLQSDGWEPQVLENDGED